MKTCELCTVDEATTTVEYRDITYDVCERCKAMAELE